MTQLSIPTQRGGESPFDSIRHEDAYGEYWLARELMPLMEYGRWHEFAAVAEKARASLALVEGHEQANHHFVIQHSDGGRWGKTKLDDYRLTRFGAYLVAMAGDDTKLAVAQARIYFAVKARKAEIAEQDTNPRHAIPQSFADALQLAADQAREIERQQAAIAELEPKAEQADHYRAADGLTAIGTFATDLQDWARKTHGVKVLHQEVRDFAAELGLLIRSHSIRKNEPTADAIKRGLMAIKNSTYERRDGTSGSARSARLTQRGVGFLWDRATARIAATGSLKPTTAVAVRED